MIIIKALLYIGIIIPVNKMNARTRSIDLCNITIEFEGSNSTKRENEIMLN
jgi:hypothetical protein